MKKAKALAADSPSIGSGTTKEYHGSAGSGRSRRPADPDDAVPGDALGLQVRTFTLITELRATEDGRTLYGRAVPYGTTVDIGRFRERFMPGVFARQVGSGQIGQIKLFDSHSNRLDGRHPIGRTTDLVERPDGLYGSWHLYDTTAAEDALRLVNAREVTGLSIGFSAKGAGTRKADDGALERVAAHLDHIALTHEPAYADAQVLAVRSEVYDRYDTDRERLRQLVLD
jgi:HK97 family phage prohead protease